MLQALFLNPFTNWLLTDGTTFLAWSVVVGMVAAYVWLRPGKGMRFAAIVLAAYFLLVRLLIAVYQTTGQYWIWQQETFTQLFLPPNQPIMYFISYVATRYWMGLGLAVLSAVVWYVFLRLLRARTERFFDEGEIALATLAVLVVGWPGIVVLLPLAGIVLVVLSVVRLVFFKQSLTTLGIPFLVATVLTVAFQGKILNVFGIQLY